MTTVPTGHRTGVLLADGPDGLPDDLGQAASRISPPLVWEIAATGETLEAALHGGRVAVVLYVAPLPSLSVSAALGLMTATAPEVPLIAVSDRFDQALALEWMEAGAADVLPRGDPIRLRLALARELWRAEYRREQQAALASLQARTQHLSDYIDTASDWYWETGPDHRFAVLPEAVRAQSILATSLVGKYRWSIAADVEEEPKKWHAHRATLDRHEPFRNFAYKIHSAQHGVRYISVSGKPLFDADGTFLGYRGSARDITEAVLASHKLRESETALVELLDRAEQAERLLRDAIESIPEGFVIFDKDDRFVMCNKAYRETYPASAHVMAHGAKFEALLREGLKNRAHADAVGREEAWLADRLHHHHEASGTSEQRLSDGRHIIAIERRMENGGIAGLRMDITALRKAEAARRDSEEQLSSIADQLPGIVFRRWLRPDGSMAIFYFSESAEDLFGRKTHGVTHDFRQRPPGLHPDDAKAFLQALRRSAETLGLMHIEVRVVNPEGEIRWLDSRSRPKRLVDGTIQWDGIALDITDRKAAEARRRELETQLQHSQKLEALGTLAGGIAHDLNNTLVPVLGLSKLRLKSMPEDNPVSEDLRAILLAGQRARALVQQILAFSRKETLEQGPLDLAAVVRDALAMLRATIPATISIAENIAELPPIHGNAGQMHQVVVNLVTNASHAIGARQGTIEVELALDPAASAARAPGARLSIRDTGCGIDPKTLTRIFEPFFTTKKIGEGTGLGLSVVHGIVTSHKGTVEVESEPGAGTRFVIRLPLAPLGAIERQPKERTLA